MAKTTTATARPTTIVEATTTPTINPICFSSFVVSGFGFFCSIYSGVANISLTGLSFTRPGVKLPKRLLE